MLKAHGKLLAALVIAFALGAGTAAYLINPRGYFSYQVVTVFAGELHDGLIQHRSRPDL